MITDHMHSAVRSALTWDYFADLPEEREAFFRIAHERRIGKRDILYVEGDAVKEISYVTEGKIILTQVNSNGKEIVLYIHGKGALIGLPGMMINIPRAVTAQALTEVVYYALPNAEFKSLLAKYPVLYERLVQQLCFGLKFMTDQYSSAFCEDAETRLIKLLARLYSEELLKLKQDCSPGSVSLAVTLDQLACAIGASRSMVSRVLHRMQDQGLIDKSAHKISFLKPELFLSSLEMLTG